MENGAIRQGFIVEIKAHTQDTMTAITSPEALRFQIGHMFDSWGIQEEVDYTLEVSRTYESVPPAAPKSDVTTEVVAARNTKKDEILGE